MRDFLDKIIEFVGKKDRGRYRDSRGHYASSNLKCLRDQYWAAVGEPETNPGDFTGSMKMLVGSAIEEGLVNAIISQLHYMGYHLRNTQASVGGSEPNWNGYLDALVDQRTDGAWRPFVVEIKTKSGIGANFFYDRPDPGQEYLTQLGLYLHDLNAKKGITDGCFLYLLLSDKHFGKLVQVNCKYDPDSKTITAYEYTNSDGKKGKLSSSRNIEEALERWRYLDYCIDQKKVPAPEYQYKHELTRDKLESMSDGQLKKIFQGAAVVGDWQVLYSRYRNKQLEVDGISPGRTFEEKSLALQEYKRRHPSSKMKVEE